MTTRHTVVPMDMIGDNVGVVGSRLTTTAHTAGGWKPVLGVQPVDDRVLWTYGPEHVTLHYRIPDAPTSGHPSFG